jgi:hypothetical protein
MQNEERINGLETQVRTLKRIVCLVCCLFGVFMFVGCSATSKSTDKDNLAQDKVEKITTVSVCRNCVDVRSEIKFINHKVTRGKIREFILSGADSRYELHSESDCQSSE